MSAMTHLRDHSLFLLRCAFALLTIWVIGSILIDGFTPLNNGRYISQMKDRNSHGKEIIALILSLAITASLIALLHKRIWGGISRGIIAWLLYVILTTNSFSGEHNAAYMGVVLLYGLFAIFTVMLVTTELGAFTVAALPIGLLAMFFIGSLLGNGPSGQKFLLIGFILVECSNIFICFPRKLVWFDEFEPA
jgi:hypothetical protein